MTIDMSQFHAVFLEESAEHLDEIEHLLMALDVQEPDAEQLNSIFRAAHSIKGGAGIFGFDALIAVTHVMENLFDKARKGQYELTAGIVDQLLQVVDVLRGFLNSYGHEQAIDWSLVSESTAKLEVLLKSPQSVVDENNQGFGFFQEVPVAKPDDEAVQGFGFFSEPTPASIAASDDEGFGFFAEETAEPQRSNGSQATADDDGFGFFDALPSTSEAKGFGFFETPVAAPSTLTNVSNSSATAPAAPSAVANVPAQPPAPIVSSKSETVKTLPNKTQDESSSIRVDIQKIDSLVNLVGELVITQSMLNLIGEELQGQSAERLQTALRELERNTRDLQEGIMSIRMLPLSFVFNRFPRVVRDLSTKLHKKVELKIEGGQTEIDKGLIEKLVDPLTHLVRNSLDHGIEAPEVRAQRGKDETGTLTLKAEQKGGSIIISVIDDGGGLNRQKILSKAWENGLTINENAPDEDVWQLIMAPGFSTADQVTDVSGRGVGMDVVRRNIEAMGGKIDIESEAGLGTRMLIRLPLTLAIVDGMSVSVGQQQFIVPLVNIVESMQPTAEQLVVFSNQQMLHLRETYWPIFKLHQLMDVEPAHTDMEQAILVLVEASRSRFALMVDDLLGQQQVVIKSLEQHYKRVAGIAGATIMGDGSVALILDIESLPTLKTEIAAQRAASEGQL